MTFPASEPPHQGDGLREKLIISIFIYLVPLREHRWFSNDVTKMNDLSNGLGILVWVIDSKNKLENDVLGQTQLYGMSDVNI